MTRPVLDPFAKENKDILTASFIGPPDPYDGNIIIFRSVHELAEHHRPRGRTGKSPLHQLRVFDDGANALPAHSQNVINDPALFEKVAELPGFDPINDRYVYRYKSKIRSRRDLVREFESGS